ncbi:MAG: MarR family transcriptional regulator, partial [Methanobacterium paludis]|nr:MarR family transcriptional regulator [Methanobacterium paludis]
IDDFLFYYPLFLKKNLDRRNLNQKKVTLYYQILKILKLHGTLSTSEAGKLIYVKKQSMTHLTDKMVRKGLIKRSLNMSDRRIVNITITDKGEECFDKWQENEICELKKIFSNLDDEELKTFHSSLENIKYIFIGLLH